MTLRALALFSGGLDSLLALRLARRHGLDVRAVCFRTGFGRPAHERSARQLAVAAQLAVGFEDVAERYLHEVVLEPRFGYGSAMNPCLDCRIFMLREADRLARRQNAELLVTGDVIGQRAIDQSREVLRRVDREAGVTGRVLRPLCAGLLEPSDAERGGRIAHLPGAGAHGSARRVQLELAAELGIDDFPTPSGGCCRLAEPAFARRLRDTIDHTPRTRLRAADLRLLHAGRHFRLSWELKAIVARDRQESEWLLAHAGGRWTGQTVSRRGAVVVVEGALDEGSLPLVASLVARYSAERALGAVEVRLQRGESERRLLATAASEELLQRWRI